MIDEKYKEIATQALLPGFGITSFIIAGVNESIKRSAQVVETGDLEKIKKELKLKEMETKISELEAKVSQEIAIAKRIENAVDVEIEEYYEGSGSGNIGVSSDGKTLKGNVGGEGKKVIKRIIKFKGNSLIEMKVE